MGGILDPTALAEPFDNILTDVIDFANNFFSSLQGAITFPWSSRPLHVSFVNDKNVNAFAGKKKNFDYIFINAGVIEKIYGTMMGMLSIPTFLPGIGSIENEEAPEQALNGGFPRMPLLRKGVEPEPFQICIPADEHRNSFAMWLAECAVTFLVLHEIGHVLAGHLEILEQQGLAPQIAEFSDSRMTGEAMPPTGILEYDADTFASHAASFLDLHPKSDSDWEGVFDWDNVPGKEAGFIAHAVMISILFRVLEVRGQAPQSLNLTSHPHPAVRSNLAISRSFSLACDSERFTVTDLPRIIQSSLIPFEETWAELGLPGQRLGNPSTWAQPIARLSDQLSQEYERWQPSLKDVARLPRRWHGSWPTPN